MRELPILFSTPMVQTLLNTKPGTWPPEPIYPDKPHKWQMRRVVKPQPDTCCQLIVEYGKLKEIWRGDCWVWNSKTIGKLRYNIGDILWIRETLRCRDFDENTKELYIQYAVDGTSKHIAFIKDRFDKFKSYDGLNMEGFHFHAP